MPLDRFMALANDRYYASRDPFGTNGDFATAPEISQMFGELVGLCLADLWQRAGGPACVYVELGPGRGTLAVDAARAMRAAGLAPDIHLVETSPLLRERQRARLPEASWHASVATLPRDRALLIVANEFFDALPIARAIRANDGWHEQVVAMGDEGLELRAGERIDDAAIPLGAHAVEPSGIVERRPAAAAIVADLGRRLATQGGALFAVDYGHDGRAAGDTLQAVRGHAFADPLDRPGETDLTAHVDFGALADVARGGGAQVFGPIEQGQWLTALGIAGRAAALARGAPDRADEIAAAHHRLVHRDAMGRLFKVLAVVAPGWPAPAGIA